MEGPPWPSSLWSSSPTVSRLKADLDEVDWEATGLTYIAVEAVWHVGLFAACFRFKPVSRLATSGSGFIAIALSTHLERQAVMVEVAARRWRRCRSSNRLLERQRLELAQR